MQNLAVFSRTKMKFFLSRSIAYAQNLVNICYKFVNFCFSVYIHILMMLLSLQHLYDFIVIFDRHFVFSTLCHVLVLIICLDAGVQDWSLSFCFVSSILKVSNFNTLNLFLILFHKDLINKLLTITFIPNN